MTKRLWLGAIGLLLAAGIAALLIFILRPPIPPRYLQQAGFGIWYPRGDYKIDAGTLAVNKSGEDILATFSADGPYGRLGFTEQAEPGSFLDVPQVYDKLIEKLQGYSSFNSANGKVDLTLPVELKGRQTAVMDSKGTLMFVKPDKNLTDDQWRRVFNALQFTH